MTGRISIGVDPGSRWTGLTMRQDDAWLAHRLLRRLSTDPLPDRRACDEVIRHLEVLVDLARRLDPRRPLIALEQVVVPRWYLRNREKPVNPAHSIGVGILYGAILQRFSTDPDVELVLVKPNKHGTLPMRYYPPELRDPALRGPVSAKDIRHCCAAWDLAGLAERLARVQVALEQVAGPPTQPAVELVAAVSAAPIVAALADHDRQLTATTSTRSQEVTEGERLGRL